MQRAEEESDVVRVVVTVLQTTLRALRDNEPHGDRVLLQIVNELEETLNQWPDRPCASGQINNMLGR